MLPLISKGIYVIKFIEVKLEVHLGPDTIED